MFNWIVSNTYLESLNFDLCIIELFEIEQLDLLSVRKQMFYTYLNCDGTWNHLTLLTYVYKSNVSNIYESTRFGIK